MVVPCEEEDYKERQKKTYFMQPSAVRIALCEWTCEGDIYINRRRAPAAFNFLSFLIFVVCTNLIGRLR